MVKSLSNDLRVRVVEAVEAGASRRQAAARFGVGVSSAIRWVRSWYAYGGVRAKRRGGDRRSGRIEAHAGFLVEQIEQTPDVTLAELQGKLKGARRAGRHRHAVAVLRAPRHQLQKKPRTPPSQTGLTVPPAG